MVTEKVWRKRIGFQRAIRNQRIVTSHPSLGGSRGYSCEFRHQAVSRWRQGERRRLGASDSSIYRWRNRIVPFNMNGNKKTSKIRGHDHFLHYFYRLIFPNATADEVRRWIFENSRYPKIYSRPDITKAEIDWHFSRKRCSTLANQAIAPANVARRNMFWSMPPPIGILNINRYTLLDLDECGLHLTSANRSEGKAKVNVRVACICIGNYGHSDKLTIIAAVDASGFKDLYITINQGRRRHYSLNIFVVY